MTHVPLKAQARFMIDRKLKGEQRMEALRRLNNPHRTTEDFKRVIDRLTPLPDVDRETAHPQSQFGPEAIARIRAERASGMTLQALADLHQTSFSTIRRLTR